MYVLVGEPVPTSDLVRGKLSPGHAPKLAPFQVRPQCGWGRQQRAQKCRGARADQLNSAILSSSLRAAMAASAGWRDAGGGGGATALAGGGGGSDAAGAGGSDSARGANALGGGLVGG